MDRQLLGLEKAKDWIKVAGCCKRRSPSDKEKQRM